LSKYFRIKEKKNKVSPKFSGTKKKRTDSLVIGQKSHEKNEGLSFLGTNGKDEGLRSKKSRGFAIASC